MPLQQELGSPQTGSRRTGEARPKGRHRALLEARLRLTELAVDCTVGDLLSAALDEAEALSGSCIGFFHFVDADEENLSLQAWSTRTLAFYCRAEGKGHHYPASRAGLWVEALRKRRPVACNDYGSAQGRCGLPEGHAGLRRLATAPVFRDGRIVALLGVGNKPEPYHKADLRTIALLADLAWDIVQRKQAAERLAESEKRYRTLVETTQAVGWEYDFAADRFVYMSPTVETVTGYPPESWTDVRSWAEKIHPDDRTSALAACRREALAGRDHSFEYRLVREDGSIVWLRNLITVVKSDDAPSIMLGFMFDVTRRKEAEQALAESEARWQFALEGAQDGVWDWDVPSGKVVYSQQLAAMLGYAPEEFGATLDEWKSRVHPDDLGPVMQAVEALLSGATRHYSSEHRLRCKDGSYKWILDRGMVVSRGPEAAPLRAIGTHTDISGLKQAQYDLQEYADWFDEAERVGNFASWIWDLDTGELRWSHHYYGLLGYAPGSVVPSVELFDRHVHPQDLPALRRARANPAPGGQQPPHRHRLITADGRERWVEQSATLLQAAPGARRYLGITRDVTEEMEAGKALRESEQRQRAITDASSDAVVLVDAEGRIESFNLAAQRIFGYSEPEVLGRGITLLMGEAAASRHQAAYFAQEPSGPRNLVCERRRVAAYTKDRRRLRIEVTVSQLEVGGQTKLLCIMTDLSSQEQAEEALRKSEVLYASVVGAMSEGIIVRDSQAQILSCNASASRILGIPIDELPGPTLLERGWTVWNEQGQPVGRGELEALLTAGTALLEHGVALEWRNPAGRSIWLNINVRPVLGPAASQPGAVVISFTDITAQRQAEERLRHTQKLESLGVLAGGIAHDFNNLLASIMGNAGLALGELEASSPAYLSLQNIERASQRAADLTQQLLAYSGKGRFTLQALDLSALAEEMLQLLATAMNRKAELRLNLAPSLPAVIADAAQIRQVIMNLITNASDALEGRAGRIAIRTFTQRLDEPGLAGLLLGEGLVAGDYVGLEVSDTGSGMSSETQAKIFEPFFSTKFTGRGLGLAAVLGIVRGHHGCIQMDSQAGLGTRFRIFLPAAAAPASAPRREPVPPQAWQGSGRVLIVEDEPMVAAVLRRTLEKAGLEVRLAADGVEGLERLAREGPFSLALVDLSMPRMGGIELLKRMQAEGSPVPVVLMSGYDQSETAGELDPAALAGFLHKPFLPEAVLRAVREALAGPGDLLAAAGG